MINCFVCGKEIKNKKYCSRKCWALSQSKENNPMYGKIPWSKGKKNVFSEEALSKMRKSHLGQISGMKGKHHSEEAKEKLRKTHLGRTTMLGKHHSEEAKLKMSEKAKGRISPMKGKKLSEETKKKIREARQRQIIRNRETKIEQRLSLALMEGKIVFETYKPILGQPDIFIEPNICIFCDGNYWHANPSLYQSESVIVRNITAKQIWEKDKNVTEGLEKQGYLVLRFWEHEINRNIESCLYKIQEAIKWQLVML